MIKDYIPETVKEYKEALDASKDVKEDPTAGQKKVDETLAALRTAKEKAVKINKEFTKSMKKELPDKDKKDAVDLVKQLSEDKNIRKKLLMKLLEIESGE